MNVLVHQLWVLECQILSGRACGRPEIARRQGRAGFRVGGWPRRGIAGHLDFAESLEIAAIGHRVVHGDEEFFDSALIDDSVLAAIEACVPLAPLHNPARSKAW